MPSLRLRILAYILNFLQGWQGWIYLISNKLCHAVNSGRELRSRRVNYRVSANGTRHCVAALHFDKPYTDWTTNGTSGIRVDRMD